VRRTSAVKSGQQRGRLMFAMDATAGDYGVRPYN